MKLEGLKLAAENRILMLSLLEVEGSGWFWKSRLRFDLSFVPRSFLLGYNTTSGKSVTVLIENKHWHIFFSVETLLTAPQNIYENPREINNILTSEKSKGTRNIHVN